MPYCAACLRETGAAAVLVVVGASAHRFCDEGCAALWLSQRQADNYRHVLVASGDMNVLAELAKWPEVPPPLKVEEN